MSTHKFRLADINMGDAVRLNRFFPRMIVVDIDGDWVTAAIGDSELELPAYCFMRVDDSDGGEGDR